MGVCRPKKSGFGPFQIQPKMRVEGSRRLFVVLLPVNLSFARISILLYLYQNCELAIFISFWLFCNSLKDLHYLCAKSAFRCNQTNVQIDALPPQILFTRSRLPRFSCSDGVNSSSILLWAIICLMKQLVTLMIMLSKFQRHSFRCYKAASANIFY